MPTRLPAAAAGFGVAGTLEKGAEGRPGIALQGMSAPLTPETRKTAGISAVCKPVGPRVDPAGSTATRYHGASSTGNPQRDIGLAGQINYRMPNPVAV
jgi:hypothetical protein